MGKVPTAVSFSALKEFEECPRRYAEKRVYKRVKDTKSHALVRGNDIHVALRYGVEGEARWQERLAKVIGDVPPWLVELVEGLRSCGAMAEYKVGLTYDLDVVDYWSPDVWMRMSFDVFVPESLLVLDWKTGKSPGDIWQLQLYSLAASVVTGRKGEVTNWFIYIDRDDTEKWVIGEEAMMAGLKRAYDDYDKILECFEKKEWPARPGFYCRWCPLRDKCPEGQRALGETPIVKGGDNER